MRASIFSLVVLVLCPGIVRALQKTPDVRVDLGDSPGSAESLFPRIAASGSAVYVVWQDRRMASEFHVYFNRSLDGGATWATDATRLDVAAAVAGGGDLALGASVYFVYGDADGVHFRRSDDQGASLSPDVVIGDGSAARIAADGDHLFVVYESRRDGASDVYFNRSLDGGTSWLAADVRLDRGDVAGSADSEFPQLVVSGGHVYVAWADLRNDELNRDVYANASGDGGDTWLASDVRLDTGRAAGAGSSGPPRLAAQGDRAYAAWSDVRGGEGGTYLNRSSDGGVTWLASDLRLDHPPAGSAFVGYVALALAGSGSTSDVYVAWSDDRDGLAPLGAGAIVLAHSADAGATWPTVDQPLSHRRSVDGGAGGTALVAQGPRVYASWWDRSADGGIYFNRSLDRGATWLASDVRLDVGTPPNDPGVPDPRLALSEGSVYAVWEDSRNDVHLGRRDIYFNLALGHQPYGAGSAGSGGLVPELTSTGAPSLGRTLRFDVSQGLGGAAGILAYGFAGPASIPVRGTTLLVRPPLVQRPFVLSGAGGGPGAGTATLLVTLPSTVALIGRRMNAQAVVLDPGAPTGIAPSGGLELWIL